MLSCVVALMALVLSYVTAWLRGWGYGAAGDVLVVVFR